MTGWLSLDNLPNMASILQRTLLVSAVILIGMAVYFLPVSVDLLDGGFKEVLPSTSSKPLQQSQQPLHEQQYKQWLSNFTAVDPSYQDFCLRVIKDGQGGASQFEQDAFLFHNLFKYWPMQGRRGFYVDSGANDAIQLSNTLFFDKCLGWDGLCVEPNPSYHEGLRKHRSCKLVGECISDRSRNVSFRMEGELGSVVVTADSDVLAPGPAASNAGDIVHCSPLSDMLARAGRKLADGVDLWSLDVEGYEMTVLQTIDFKRVIQVRAIIIEELYLSTRELDLFMDRSGFQKFHQLAIDAIYVKRNDPINNGERNNIWYPPLFQQNLESNRVFREQNKHRLKC